MIYVAAGVKQVTLAQINNEGEDYLILSKHHISDQCLQESTQS